MIALGMCDVNMRTCIIGLGCISSELILSGGAFHLYQAVTKHTLTSFSQGLQRWATCGDRKAGQRALVPSWSLGSRKAPSDPVAPWFAGGTLEVAEEGTRGGGWATTATLSLAVGMKVPTSMSL